MPLQSKSTQKKKSKSLIDFNSAFFFKAISSLTFAGLLTGCVAPPAQVSLTELSARPAEKALLSGMRAYEDAQYPEAEKLLTEALAAGFTVKKDATLAHKYLAFIYCTSARMEDCKQAFLAARAADPSFSLTKKEIGHPQWGPVYKQVFGE
jgi:Tfp pilus assembly protein PilF